MHNINSAHKRELRRALCEAAGHRCEYCRRPTRLTEGTVDHYLPQALGGTNARRNLRWACVGCNNAKADMPPAEWERCRPRPVEPISKHEVRCALLARCALRQR